MEKDIQLQKINLACGLTLRRLFLSNLETLRLLLLVDLSAELAIHAARMEKIKLNLNTILAENTGKPLEIIQRDTERDNFMSAKEAMEYGLIDKVIEKR